MELKSKYGEVKIFTEQVEEAALSQIITLANSELGEDAHIRIMPDTHAGAGCTIGTTILVGDKVCPNLIGVDIGCGVLYVETEKNLSHSLDALDDFIRNNIPVGMDIWEEPCLKEIAFVNLRCWDKLPEVVKERALRSVGTLGGGNHFIEAYQHGFSIHTGSRNIGMSVAKYYQSLAEKQCKEHNGELLLRILDGVPLRDREEFIKQHKITVPKDLCYLTGDLKDDYLNDVSIMQSFASLNRQAIAVDIAEFLCVATQPSIHTIHNYIDRKNGILRKGAVSAQKGEKLVIPLNMRDGLLICEGKGNEDWNYSAPHGAGRLYSRSKAKEVIALEDYQKSMQGIYTTCVNESTIDESPFAYKDYKMIMEAIEPTATVIERLKPIYNFKAN